MKISRWLKFKTFLSRQHKRLPFVRALPLPVFMTAVSLVLISVGTVAYQGIIIDSGNVDLTRGLVGYWNFNGSAQDSSGNGNHGTVTGATLTMDRHGNANSAYSFDGTDDFISAPGSTGIADWPNGMSVAVWVKSNTATWDDTGMLVSKRTSFLLSPDTGTTRMRLYRFSGGYTSGYHTSTADITTWNHYVATYDNGSIKIYENGELKSSVSISGVMASDTGSIYFGSDDLADGFNRFLNGSLDDVRIYNRALSQAEVEATYNSGDLVNLAAGLDGHWELDGMTVTGSVPATVGPNGTAYGQATQATSYATDRIGQTNKAFNFDGTDDWVSIGSAYGAYNAAAGQARTYSIWFKSTEQNFLAWEEGGCTGWRIQLMDGGKVRTQYRTGDGACSGTTLHELDSTSAGHDDGEWHLLTLVADRHGGSLKLYIDGQFDNSIALNTTQTFVGGNLRLGTQWDTSSYYTGVLDDFRVYNRSLNDAEVAALYGAPVQKSEVQVSGLQKGLVGHWDFDGDAKDKTPYGNHGTITGAVVAADRTAAFGSAYSFDGVNDLVTIADNSVLDLTEEITISAWVYVSDASAPRTIVSKKRGVNSNYVLAVGQHTAGKLTFQVYKNSTGHGSMHVSNSDLPVGQWIHVVARHAWGDASSTKFYVNGLEYAGSYVSGTGGEAANVNTGVLKIGMDTDDGDGNERPFSGSIDDVRIYDRVITQDEISQLYDSYKPVITLSELSKGLVGHWNFNGDAKDKTPYSNHGTLAGNTVLAADRQSLTSSAYSFDGSGDYISLPDYTVLNGTSAMTVCGWIKLSSLTLDGAIFTRVQDTANNEATLLWYNAEAGDGKTQTFTFNVRNTSDTKNRVDAASGTAILNQWTHVCGVMSGASRSIFVNGIISGTSNVGYSSAASGASTTRIGASRWHSMDVNGAIDDVRIYNRALTQPEIQRLYESN